MNINFGDIYLVRSKNWWDKAIRFWTRSKFNHAGIYINENVGFEATFSGIKFVNMKTEYNSNDQITVLRLQKKLTPIEKADLQNFIKEHNKAEYDFKAILGCLLFKRWNSKGKYYCFELVWNAYESMGRSLGRLDEGYVDGSLIFASNDLFVVTDNLEISGE